jgi:hypothetical protein
MKSQRADWFKMSPVFKLANQMLEFLDTSPISVLWAEDYKTGIGDQSQISSIRLAKTEISLHFSQSDARDLRLVSHLSCYNLRPWSWTLGVFYYTGAVFTEISAGKTLYRQQRNPRRNKLNL